MFPNMADLISLRTRFDRLDGSGNDGHRTHNIPMTRTEHESEPLSGTVTGPLEQLERELQRQRQFVSDTAHELRTPIAGLRVQLEEAQLHPEQSSLPNVLARALSDVDRLEKIVSDLLLLARLGAGALPAREKVDLAELVETEVSRRVDRIAVRLRLERETIINAVRVQIGRALTNLVNNAQLHAEQTVEIEVCRNGDCAELAVTDDGGGVAEADRERIFERFTRLSASRSRDCRGTGLGLAIARDIAHAHHGTLRAEASASGGARFVLRLPLA
jgi:signal transduction histidine kinase